MRTKESERVLAIQRLGMAQLSPGKGGGWEVVQV